MWGIRDRQLGVLVAFMFAPFALQLVGWAGTPLGGGPCGAIGPDRFLLEQPQAFFYAQIMLWGISLLLATGFFILMLAFMHSNRVPKSQARPFVRVGLGLSTLTALIYLLTHTVGLPAPSPIGWLMSGPEPTDAIGILVLLALFGQIALALRWLAQPEPAKLALEAARHPSKAH
ncbi:hypothetical protein [Meiothermus sp.]|uniref:hypothetical protein n=1 Tax=Meiothermus sp. TaxID=1955249 RepID=UPI0021DC8FB3|nr:hypothetical protein [Meiothermus sp.]GIW24249.1 MAG: hypothetical protein KatS3mg069_0516 [Meiothermus sp.]